MKWINEVPAAKLGDARLSQRLNRMADKLSENPERTLPEATGSRSETKAAYRFFDNEKVKVSSIYEAQQNASIERIKEESMIPAVQDTTVFNYTSKRRKIELGPSCSFGGVQGFFLHSCLAVSAKGIPLGVIGHRMWIRPKESKNSEKSHKARPIKDKESVRRVEVAREVSDMLPLSAKVVMVADRESDIYEVIALALEGYEFLIRAAWNRRSNQSDDYLRQAAAKAPIYRNQRPAYESIGSIQYSCCLSAPADLSGTSSAGFALLLRIQRKRMDYAFYGCSQNVRFT